MVFVQKTVVFSSKVRRIKMYTLGNMFVFAALCGVIATMVTFIAGYYLILLLLVLCGVLIGMQIEQVLRGG